MVKLNWGLIGGGEGSQIGPVHRMAARLDGEFSLVAAALDHVPDAGRDFAIRLGVPAERAYGDWKEMLARESSLGDGDRLDLVTVATPNSTHFEITRRILESGFNVLCEKPMTMTVSEAAGIVKTVTSTGCICAVNYGYSGYPLVRQMRAMVRDGVLGRVRLVVVEFAHGHHSAGDDRDNPRVRWRYDPAQVGVSAQFTDCGIHALHLATFVTGRDVLRLASDFASCVDGRELEDDAQVDFRLEDGIVGRLWTSAVAVGRQHGLTIQVYGERGGLRWAQEQANQLFWTPVGGRTSTIERGEAGLAPETERASRVAVGHVEGMPLAFANIYSELSRAIRSMKAGNGDVGSVKNLDGSGYLYPSAEDGMRSVVAIHAAVLSARERGRWVELSDVQASALTGD